MVFRELCGLGGGMSPERSSNLDEVHRSTIHTIIILNMRGLIKFIQHTNKQVAGGIWKNGFRKCCCLCVLVVQQAGSHAAATAALCVTGLSQSQTMTMSLPSSRLSSHRAFGFTLFLATPSVAFKAWNLPVTLWPYRLRNRNQHYLAGPETSVTSEKCWHVDILLSLYDILKKMLLWWVRATLCSSWSPEPEQMWDV